MHKSLIINESIFTKTLDFLRGSCIMVYMIETNEKKKIMNITDYISPHHEYSLFKGIPISERYSDEVKSLMQSGRYRIKYRGKSKLGWRRPRNYTTKQYADTFAIYRR